VKAPISLQSDDFMADASKPLWSATGRDDLGVMRRLGANAVRLYGNNPELDHTTFLNEAHANGIRVIPGMSDYVYFQAPEDNCVMSGYNCYDQVKKQYAMNLERGFLTKDKSYHPALFTFILINEPDLKMPSTASVVFEGASQMARAIASAFDGVLDAEREAGVVGEAINFTATISFAICTACPSHNDAPALGQMALIADAFHNPEMYGYEPKNDLAANFKKRWVHSFNTANDAEDLKKKFFARYQKAFTQTPVFIGEYHNLLKPLTSDVKDVLKLAGDMPLFLGISFFEFQVAYWKGGAEMAFGLFELGGYPVTEMSFLDHKNYTVWCLSPSAKVVASEGLPRALAEAYGGKDVDAEELCLPQPATVPLSPLGYNLITGLHDTGRLAEYLRRIGEHMGADITDVVGLREFAKMYLHGSGPGFEFDDVVKDMPKAPWLSINPNAACVANRNASAAAVQEAVEWGCGHLTGYSCSAIDDSCQSDVFAKGDWVFSRYYRSVKQLGSSSLQMCSFGGAAIYASPKLNGGFQSGCVLQSAGAEETV